MKIIDAESVKFSLNLAIESFFTLVISIAELNGIDINDENRSLDDIKIPLKQTIMNTVDSEPEIDLISLRNYLQEKYSLGE